jgi:hypothetical protein
MGDRRRAVAPERSERIMRRANELNPLALLYLNERHAIDAALSQHDISVVVGHHIANDPAA